MNRLVAIVVALVTSFSFSVNQAYEIQHTHASDELIVKLKQGSESIKVLKKLNKRYKVLEVTKLSGDRRFLLRFPSNTNLNKAIDDYKKNKHVESAEPNYANSRIATDTLQNTIFMVFFYIFEKGEK